MIRVLIADDHADVRSSLTELLGQSPDIDVVAVCADGDEVLAAAQDTRPDVALLDLSMPRRGGLDAAKDLREFLPDVRIVILTGLMDEAAVQETRAIGAAGYLLKGEDPDALTGHLRAVASGGAAWDPTALRILQSTRNGDAPPPEQEPES